MRALTTAGQDMTSIKGGTQVLSRALELACRQAGVEMKSGHTLRNFQYSRNIRKIIMQFEGGEESAIADRLVLALPQLPLKNLSTYFPKNIQTHLDSVIPLPLTKVFFITDKPWWKPDTPPQTRANYMPTREVHYFRASGTTDGMVMVYTDRPATEYWNLFVKDKNDHTHREENKNPMLKEEFARWFAEEIQGCVECGGTNTFGLQLNAEAMTAYAGKSTAEIAEVLSGSLKLYSIRDWERAPFGAAAHLWRPEVDSRKVRRELAGFSAPLSSAENVHICGEAYSDYRGFIEGSLNSAQLVLDRISRLA
ncbi:MAG: FAD-dependent oxidoreductase [Bacteroidota bacterium]